MTFDTPSLIFSYHASTSFVMDGLICFNPAAKSALDIVTALFCTYDFGGTYDPKTSPVSDSYSVVVSADQWTEEDISNSSTGVTVVASERIRINGIITKVFYFSALKIEV